jgi:FAD/FMN-containing dehydrogenase
MVIEQAQRSTTLDEQAIAELRAAMQGEVIAPEDEGYAGARLVWNGLIDRFPALIARPTGVADVVAAVGFARKYDLEVAVRGGGHNVAGTAVCDDGLVIDLARMKSIRVDPAARTVRAEAGVTWAELDRETQVFGLATPGGEVSVTGIAGLTLGGGIGALRRKYGLSCDNLISVDLVTADGRFLTASETEHADLFWGLRGGGFGLGVVTSFEFRLHPIGPAVYSAQLWHFIEGAAGAGELLRDWRDFVAQVPDEVTSIALLWSIPPIPNFPAQLHGKPVVILSSFYVGPPEDGERALQPLRALGTPFADLSGPSTFLAKQRGFDPFFPEGLRYYWKSVALDTLSDEAIDATLARVATRPSPATLVALRHLGGAMARVPEGATAYGNRSANFNLSFDATWADRRDDEANIAWAREAWGALLPHADGGIYLNFAGLGEEGQALPRAALRANYERLADLRRRYDPGNLFRSRLNVAPGND